MTDYFEQTRQLLAELPPLVGDFFYTKQDNYQIRTRLGYAQDLRIFFNWMLDTCDDMPETIREIDKEHINRIDNDDIYAFLDYLNYYQSHNPVHADGDIKKNTAVGKARKLAALRSFFKFLRIRKLIDHNPCDLVETPKIHKAKAILTLSDEQQQIMLDNAIDAKGKPLKKGIVDEERTKSLREHTKYRDFAILTTFLGTGLRVSELVNIELDDIDFREQRIFVIRKGGSKDFVYFNSAVFNAILDYMDYERDRLLHIKRDKDKEDDSPSSGPLFIARGGKRITVRRIQQIVKEYAVFAVPSSQKVSPHTLRKTFGTALYEKYKDLALAQHALGHENAQTTSEHYVNYNKDNLKILRAD